MFEKKVFISHSSKNRQIANALSVYLSQIGVNSENIFCSSIVGQGIENGKELGSAIFNKINQSTLLIFLMSQDFLDSSFCIEELGIGWYLLKQKKKICFFLLLPDITPDDVHGFINKNIQQFALLDLQDRNPFDQFSQDILNIFNIKRLNVAALNRVKNDFFNAIEPHCKELISAKTLFNKEREFTKELRNELDVLKKQNHNLEDSFFKKINEINSAAEQENLLIELKTIERLLFQIGSIYGISKDLFSKVSKTFWFESIHRYIELLKLTNNSPRDKTVELLAATLFAIDGDTEEAKKHILSAVTLYTINEASLHKYMLNNFFEVYKESMADEIQILKSKLPSCKAGLVKDSYIDIIHELEAREKTISENQI